MALLRNKSHVDFENWSIGTFSFLKLKTTCQNILDSLLLVPKFNPHMARRKRKILDWTCVSAFGDCWIFKFLRRDVDRKYMMRFQSENAVLEFLRNSVDMALINDSSYGHQNTCCILVLHQKCVPYLLFPCSNLQL